MQLRAQISFFRLAGVPRALRLAPPPAYYLSSLAGLLNSAGIRPQGEELAMLRAFRARALSVALASLILSA